MTKVYKCQLFKLVDQSKREMRSSNHTRIARRLLRVKYVSLFHLNMKWMRGTYLVPCKLLSSSLPEFLKVVTGTSIKAKRETCRKLYLDPDTKLYTDGLSHLHSTLSVIPLDLCFTRKLTLHYYFCFV